MAELLLALPGTVVAFFGARRLHRATGLAVLHPTLVALVLVGLVVLATGADYDRYRDGAAPLTLLLGPAVVALAIPLHLEREVLRRHALPVAAGALLGAGVAMAFGYGAAQLAGLPREWIVALTSRSATSPISIALADQVPGGDAGLAATLSIITGIIGAALGPGLLDRLAVRGPVARGLAHGVNAHGVGTARMLEESRRAGAAAGAGMGLGGLAVALVLPHVL